MYDAATISVQVPNSQTRRIPLNQGVRQGCDIPEFVYKCIRGRLQDSKLEQVGHQYKRLINIALKFADDVVIMAESMQEVQEMLHSLNKSSQLIDLRMNQRKMKVVTSSLQDK